ncbi:alpha-E domain-containing protein [Pedobacter sp. HMF7647]|uniref:Alpha-E domain-containing protein n=1 Tax=Hufsiella arboris TaxID=2695275 RepID=A0A7K1YAX8_9SPHI|nr:alpha-E domain-containing protein [Hufsiella arboris]MXV51747.1 alpha-E domain-containing protein [Hufsiella arboris]
MLSRVADSLYWLSRYVERSDGILRMLKINYATSQDSISEFSWEPVINIFAPSNENAPDIKNSREVLQYMITDKENHYSVLNIITRARENARSVQDHITKDLWQSLNEYYLIVRDSAVKKSLQKDDPVSALDLLIKQVMLFYGTAEISMARGEGRSFMSIGKYLERSIQSVDILDIKFGTASSNPDLLSDTSYWKNLLLSIGGYELYLKCYRQGFEAENVLEQVVLNVDFPRSVLYAINQLKRYFERLRSDSNMESYLELLFTIGKLQSRIQYSSVQTIREEGLHAFLTDTRQELFKIGNALNKHYFAYT